MAKTKPAIKTTAAGSTTVSETSVLFHRIQALLHTMHCIGQYEDELCTLLHAAKVGTTKAWTTKDAGFDDELRELLEKLPAHEYVQEIDSLREGLPVVAAKRKRPDVAKRNAAVKSAAKRK